MTATQLPSALPQPPSNLEAEAAVLGGIMVSEAAMEAVSDILKASYFYRPQHADIFRAALAIHMRGDPVDIVILTAELDKAGILERVGGAEYLAALQGSAGITANIPSYARLVEEAAVRRGLLAAGSMIQGLGQDTTTDIEQALDLAGNEILRLTNERSTQQAVHLKDALSQYWEDLEKLHENPGSAPGVRTGYADLDRMTGGLQPGSLVIIAARPSVGKTSLALNICQHVALNEKTAVAVFSLEMSRYELTQRLLCGEAGIDSFKLRSGQLNEGDWSKVANAMGRLSEGEIYIDDRPGQTPLEMRAKARRLQMQKGIGLIVIDYIQLMSGNMRTDNRVQEVSEISRSLKRLAVELEVPVIALSQLSRAPEQRSDRRPQLSDLRESGCLTGDTRVYLPDVGRYERIDALVGQSGFNVLALNPETWRMERKPVVRAFSTGVKDVFSLNLGLGRRIRATANHKFRTFAGWKRLDELEVGDRVAVPRFLQGPLTHTMADAELALLGHLIGDGCTLPRHAIQYTTREVDLARRVADLATEVFGAAVGPRIKHERSWFQVYLPSRQRLTHGVHNPVTTWLSDLGVFGLRSHEKRIPPKVFEQSLQQIAHFLRHLWCTDGCIRAPHHIYYATSSAVLARDVQSLLLRLGINAVVRRVAQVGKGRDQFHVLVMGKVEIERFLMLVGAVNEERKMQQVGILLELADVKFNTNRDIIPAQVWETHARPAMRAAGITGRQFQAGIGMHYAGSGLFRQNVGRERAARIGEFLKNEQILRISESDVYWDRVTDIAPDGREAVYDLTVADLHNFVADDIVVHNSIEQDADMVMFLFREGLHNEEVKRNKTELIVAKHRSGPIGEVQLLFLESQTRFVSVSRATPPGAQGEH